MSANNWMECPKCRAEAEAKPEAALIGISLPDEFREDWEIGMMKDGRFFVDYHGHCQSCGFKHQFNFEQQTLK